MYALRTHVNKTQIVLNISKLRSITHLQIYKSDGIIFSTN